MLSIVSVLWADLIKTHLWTQQLLKITKKKKKKKKEKLSSTGNSGLAYGVPVVAPSSVIEEGSSSTPDF